MALKENYKDDILDVSVNTKRKYRMTENADGTISLDDETVYTQEGDNFGASDMNAITHFINNIHLDALQGVLYNSGDTSALANSIDAYIAQANMSDNTTQNVILSNNSTATKWIVEITRVGDNYSGTALKTTTKNDYRYSFIKIGGASTEITPFSSKNFTMVIKVTAYGYGAYGTYSSYTEGNSTLLVTLTKNVTIKCVNGTITITNGSGWSGYKETGSQTRQYVGVRLVSVNLVSLTWD